jgi:NAD(P)-dependent dehydrogenase (short-subunit alcohol dehydrogenase family)
MLDDKVVLVTGAGGGLGEATAKTMADHGATLVLNDLGVAPDGTGGGTETPVESTAADIRSAGGTVTASFGDVTDFDYVAALVETAIDEYGRLDGVVNYAGFMREHMVFNMPPADWEAVVDVHLTGHFNLLHHAGKRWRARYKQGDRDGETAFLAVSSAAALGTAGSSNYSAAKAGVLGLMRTTARELHQYDVRVNAMLPAGMTRLVPDAVRESVPAERAGAEQVAPLPVVLVSDAATGVTGWTFAIGGDTVYTVTDPALDTDATRRGGWTAGDLAGALDQLLARGPRAKTEPGHLLPEILEDREE